MHARFEDESHWFLRAPEPKEPTASLLRGSAVIAVAASTKRRNRRDFRILRQIGGCVRARGPSADRRRNPLLCRDGLGSSRDAVSHPSGGSVRSAPLGLGGRRRREPFAARRRVPPRRRVRARAREDRPWHGRPVSRPGQRARCRAGAIEPSRADRFRCRVSELERVPINRLARASGVATKGAVTKDV